MKVYSLPEELPAPEIDYLHYDVSEYDTACRKHQEALRNWLVAAGYTGKYTGLVYRTPVADGYASYMIGDKGRGGILIHLPYGDAWQARDVEFIPKSEIVKRAEQQSKVRSMFG